jgi:hypothetical protein
MDCGHDTQRALAGSLHYPDRRRGYGDLSALRRPADARQGRPLRSRQALALDHRHHRRAQAEGRAPPADRPRRRRAPRRYAPPQRRGCRSSRRRYDRIPAAVSKPCSMPTGPTWSGCGRHSMETAALLYRAASAVLANSRHEPFGLVGLERDHGAVAGVACTGGLGRGLRHPGAQRDRAPRRGSGGSDRSPSDGSGPSKLLSKFTDHGTIQIEDTPMPTWSPQKESLDGLIRRRSVNSCRTNTSLVVRHQT